MRRKLMVTGAANLLFCMFFGPLLIAPVPSTSAALPGKEGTGDIPDAKLLARGRSQEGTGKTGGAEPPRVGTAAPLLTVTVAGVKHRLLFEDAELPMGTRTTLAHDITHLFGEVFKTTIDYPRKERTIFQLQYNLSLYWLHAPNYTYMLPQVLQDHFKGGIRQGKVHYLLVPKKVSSRYEEAIELKKKHAKKFKKLDEFLALMNDKESRRRAADTLEKARRLVHFDEVKPWDDYAKYRRALHLAPGASLNIKRLSLLYFKYTKEMEPRRLMSGVWMRTQSGPDEEEYMGAWPLIYSGGRWKFWVVPMP
jgi:hypothetical protein